MSLEKALSRLHQLPAIPAVVQEVVASFNTSNIDLGELAGKIGHDQALTAKLLRVANSSFYGFPRQIASIQDAVVVMGLASVRSLVLSVGFVHAFGREHEGALDRVEYWKRCFRIASYAKAIAKCVRQPQEVAFTAGMLHDIGQLVLDVCLQEQYGEIVTKAKAEGSGLIAVEEAMLGFHHGTLGAEVARRWNFPPVIEQAIRDCHAPHSGFLEPISATVCMAVRLDQGMPPESVLDAVSPNVRERLGLDAARLAAALPDPGQIEAAVAGLLG